MFWVSYSMTSSSLYFDENFLNFYVARLLLNFYLFSASRILVKVTILSLKFPSKSILSED